MTVFARKIVVDGDPRVEPEDDTFVETEDDTFVESEDDTRGCSFCVIVGLDSTISALKDSIVDGDSSTALGMTEDDRVTEA